MSSSSSNPTDIAIIGMAGRFPNAQNVAELWELLRDGRSGVRDISPNPGSRLPNDPNYVAKAATVEGADHFDASFFGMYPKQAAELDPQHRLFLETAWHALEDAGYCPDGIEQPVGVFAGCHMNTYIFQRLAQDPELRETLADSYPGGNLPTEISNDKDYLATRVAFHLNLRGPCVAVQTACSTSLVAVAQACESIESGACEMALAGGATITFPQDQGYLHTEDSILSPDGVCRTFDANAKGTIFGDGVGAVVLKRLDCALRDRDSIYAVIKGWGVNNDGSDKGGYTAPSPSGQRTAIERAHQKAGVSADTISYVEAHGTGTIVGDPIEVSALTEAFRKTTDQKQYCAIGSLKSNLGHLDVAAGVTALIKVAMSLANKQIPASLNFESPNPRIDFEQSPFYVQTELGDWDLPQHFPADSKRRAGISSFGVGGTNAHIVLEESTLSPPESSTERTLDPTPQLLCVSANDEESLEQARLDLAKHIANQPSDQLSNSAYTLLSGRKHFSHRSSVVVSNPEEAATKLEGNQLFRKSPKKEPSVVFMFPGQGSQHVGMAGSLYREDEEFRSYLDEIACALEPHVGLDLRTTMFQSVQSGTAPSTIDLNETAYAQPTIFLVSLSLARWFQAKGISASRLVGHSVGEFAAAAFAGVMSTDDAALLVAQRGRLMQQMQPGGMLAINLPKSQLKPQLPAGLEIAAENAPALSVVSGPSDLVEQFANSIEAGELGETTVGRLLKTSHAFHSAMMDPAVEQFRDTAASIQLHPPKIPITSTVTASTMTDAMATAPEYWTRQIREPVLFSDGIASLLNQESLAFLEVGPGQALSTLARKQDFDKTTHTVISSLPHPKQESACAHRHALEAVGKLWESGVHIEANRLYASEERRRVHLPTYPFQRKRHWFTVASNPNLNASNSIDHVVSIDQPASTDLAAKIGTTSGDNSDLPPSRQLPKQTSQNAGIGTPPQAPLSPSSPAANTAVERIALEHMKIMRQQLELMIKSRNQE